MELRKALVTSVLIASLAATSATAGERAPLAGGGSNHDEILAGAVILGVIGWLIYTVSSGGTGGDGSTVSSSGSTGDASGSGRQRGKLLMKF